MSKKTSCCSGGGGGGCGGGKAKKPPQDEVVEAAKELPFRAAVEDTTSMDLTTLAEIPEVTKEKCAFVLDGKPCRLCNEDEEEEEIEESENTETSVIIQESTIIEHPLPQLPMAKLAADVAERRQQIQQECSSSKRSSSTKCCSSSKVKREDEQVIITLKEETSGSACTIKNEKTAASVKPISKYELKKQKAKEKRILFNDALDRLGEAMQLATEKSIQRDAQLKATDNNAQQQQSLVLTPLQTTLTAAKLPKHAMCQIDRPSLVGAAADMLHQVTQHCDTLTQEVVRLRAQLNLNKERGNVGDSTTASGASSSACSSNKRKQPCCGGGGKKQKCSSESV